MFMNLLFYHECCIQRSKGPPTKNLVLHASSDPVVALAVVALAVVALAEAAAVVAGMVAVVEKVVAVRAAAEVVFLEQAPQSQVFLVGAFIDLVADCNKH